MVLSFKDFCTYQQILFLRHYLFICHLLTVALRSGAHSTRIICWQCSYSCIVCLLFLFVVYCIQRPAFNCSCNFLMMLTLRARYRELSSIEVMLQWKFSRGDESVWFSGFSRVVPECVHRSGARLLCNDFMFSTSYGGTVIIASFSLYLVSVADLKLFRTLKLSCSQSYCFSSLLFFIVRAILLSQWYLEANLVVHKYMLCKSQFFCAQVLN